MCIKTNNIHEQASYGQTETGVMVSFFHCAHLSRMPTNMNFWGFFFLLFANFVSQQHTWVHLHACKQHLSSNLRVHVVLKSIEQLALPIIITLFQNPVSLCYAKCTTKC